MKPWPLVALALAGCANYDRPEPLPAGPCQVSERARMQFVGTKFRERQRTALLRATHSRTARVLNPGDMATMDFRPDRLNIMLDDGGLIEGLRCG